MGNCMGTRERKNVRSDNLDIKSSKPEPEPQAELLHVHDDGQLPITPAPLHINDFELNYMHVMIIHGIIIAIQESQTNWDRVVDDLLGKHPIANSEIRQLITSGASFPDVSLETIDKWWTVSGKGATFHTFLSMLQRTQMLSLLETLVRGRDALLESGRMGNILTTEESRRECKMSYKEHNGNFDMAASANRQEAYRSFGGKENYDRVMFKLLKTLQNQTAFDEISLTRETYTAMKEVLGDEHEKTCQTQYELGLLLMNKAEFEEAWEVFQHVLKIQRNVLPPDSAEVIKTMQAIAMLLLKTKRYTESGEMWKEVLAVQLRVLGSDHPETLTTKNDIAVVLMEKGNYDDALVEFRKNFEEQKRLLGNSHLITLRSLYNITVTFRYKGLKEEAIDGLREIVTIIGQQPDMGKQMEDLLTVVKHNISVLEGKLSQVDIQKIQQNGSFFLEP